MQAVVLSQRPRPEIYAVPRALALLGDYVATEPELIGEAARQSASYAQAVGRHGLRRRFQQKRGRMAIFFDDGGRASKEVGWWITEEENFGQSCLLWCPGSIDHPPETGWQLKGYLGYYEVDLLVTANAVKEEPHSLVSATNLLFDVLGQSMMCCLKGAELMLNDFNAKMAQRGDTIVEPEVVPAAPMAAETAALAAPATAVTPPTEPLEAAELPAPAEFSTPPAAEMRRESIFPPPREVEAVPAEPWGPNWVPAEAPEEMMQEARRAKESFMESFKAHLSRFSPEEQAQKEAELAKEHFLEAFCNKGLPEEQPLRRLAAEEALAEAELQQLLLQQHRSQVDRELQQERKLHEAATDTLLLQVQELQRELRAALDARQQTEAEKLELLELQRCQLERRDLESEGVDGLQRSIAELESENAECKEKLSQAATALWSHEAALQEALQDAATLRSELLNTSAAEEEIALLREELAQLRSSESTAEASTAEAEQQMQSLAEEYQHALADIQSLRSIYDSEIDGLQEELEQCKAEGQQEVASLQEELRLAKEQQEAAKQALALQEVLSKRVVQLEAKLAQQSLEKDDMAKELELLRHRAQASADAHERATSAEEVLATTAQNFQAAEARQLQAEEQLRQMKLRCQNLEAQLVSKRTEQATVVRSEHHAVSKTSKPPSRPQPQSMGSMPAKKPVARVEGPLVSMSAALSPTAPNTPLLETRKVLVQRHA